MASIQEIPGTSEPYVAMMAAALRLVESSPKYRDNDTTLDERLGLWRKAYDAVADAYNASGGPMRG